MFSFARPRLTRFLPCGAVLVAIFSATFIAISGSVASASASPSMSSGAPVAAETKSDKSVGKKLEKLTSSLALTADQQGRIKPVLEQESAQVREVRADKTMAKTDRSAKLKTIHADTKARIASLLTPEQQKKYASMGPGHRLLAAK